MATRFFLSKFITKDFSTIDTDRRIFEGYLTVEMIDKQNEITMVDELIKCLPIWMARGAPISDTHSNRIIGKGLNYSKTTMTDENNITYPAIYIQGEIFKDYELDEEIWKMMKNGEYKGLSFGGATKSNRRPVKRADGGYAYSLWDLEHYEVAVCRDPAVPLALITRTNELAKAMAGSWEDRGNGNMCIKCNQFSCFVEKRGNGKKPSEDPQGNEWSDDPPVDIHPNEGNSEIRGMTKDETEKAGQPLVTNLRTNPISRPQSVVGGPGEAELKTEDGEEEDKKEKGNGDYPTNVMEVSDAKDRKDDKDKMDVHNPRQTSIDRVRAKQNTSTTMTAVNGEFGKKNEVYSSDDEKAAAFGKEKTTIGSQTTMNSPGTRGLGATQAHQQGPGESSQVTLLDKEPASDRGKKEKEKALLMLIKANSLSLNIRNSDI